MAENLLVGTHKVSTKEYRDGWDRIFGRRENIVEIVSEPPEEETYTEVYAIHLENGKLTKTKCEIK